MAKMTVEKKVGDSYFGIKFEKGRLPPGWPLIFNLYVDVSVCYDSLIYRVVVVICKFCKVISAV